MPKLWNETIEAHRQAVRNATLDATAALVVEHGLASVTMTQIAEATGIGRATLYKYFPDVDAILIAWHERQITSHLEYLVEVRDRASDAGDRLDAVLEAYALIQHGRLDYHQREQDGTEFAALLHRREHVVRAEQRLRTFIGELLIDARDAGQVRDDVSPEELTNYCLHALNAASSLPSEAATRRLVAVTVTGLRPIGAGATSREERL